MALIEIHHPSTRDIRVFGLVLALFFGFIGGLVWWKSGSLGTPKVLWMIGGVLAIIYYAVPRLRLVMYYGWIKLGYPVGWIISHLALLLFYYLVLTPIGLIMRAFGRDLMRRQFDRDASTYWDERNPDGHPARYFKQF